jgi:polyisoprenoid-binding protein YceI
VGTFLNRFSLITALLALVVAIAAAAPGYAPRTFVIDPAASSAVVTVGKTGLFSFAAGHVHEITSPLKGTVELDTADPARSTIRMEIDAKGLVVDPKNEPPKDVPEVQAAMLSDKCLDVAKFPTILFQSRALFVSKHTDTSWELTAAGAFTLHGVTKELTFPITAALAGDKLTAQGKFEFKQTDYGIKPISVGGVVKVEDKLAISYSVVAKPR